MKSIFKTFFVALAITVVFASCEKWEDYNTNPFGVTDEMLAADYNNIGAYYPQIMQSVYYNYNNSNWEFQLVQNLTADLWAGYFSNVSAFLSNANTGNLFMVDGWVGFEWDVTYKRVMSPIFNSIKPLADNDQYRHFYAPALIMQVMAMSRLTDCYGPCIYSKYGQSATGGNFESMQDSYNAFFADLDIAVGALENFINTTGSTTSNNFKRFDDWCNGDFSKWIRFANTLRLRLAMHIVKVDPAKAKSEAQKAIGNSYGFLSGKNDVVTMHAASWQHPLYTLSTAWNDCYMGAVIESFLTGYSDPREGKYFIETSNAAFKAAGRNFASIRMGNDAPGKGAEIPYSLLSTQKTDAAIIMVPAEAQFLLAEAALRGWVSGSAKSYYEAGVKESFNQYGVGGVDDYLASNAMPADYVNPLEPSWNIEAANFLSPKWDESASNEEKLERIIDQKYLAIYPDGYEAWTDLRRTGYPRQYPVIINASSDLKNDEIVRRCTYPQSAISSDAAGYQQALGFLGGPDKASTRLWWDVNKGNF